MFCLSGQPDRNVYADSERYTVGPGDTLFAIAEDYGIGVDTLKQANGLSSDDIVPGQVLYVPVGTTGGQQPGITMDKPLRQVLKEKGIQYVHGMKIVIDKSDHTLSLFCGDTWLKSYHVQLGEGGLGDKQVQGDRKTPEGTFYIAEKKAIDPPDYFIGSRWLLLSYPNKEAADRGLWQGIINQLTHDRIVSALSAGGIPLQYTALGGRVGIHGGDKPELGDNWTWGCIGLTNSDIEDFYDYVGIGVPVIIRP